MLSKGQIAYSISSNLSYGGGMMVLAGRGVAAEMVEGAQLWGLGLSLNCLLVGLQASLSGSMEL